nr:tail fiber domain-containing protein [Rhabdobacter roseus]
MGNDAGVNFQSGESNVAIGTRAGDFPKSGGGNTYLGRSAGSFWHYYNIDDLNLNNNTYIGNNAGLDAWGSNNTSIGTEAGALGVNNNTYLGYAAGGGFNARGRSSGGGSNNTSLGYGAGSPGSGGYNVFVGHYAGTRSSGNNNIAIGASAGLKTPEGSGQFAVPIGSNNIFIGDSTGQSNNANNNILIGSKTGYQNTTGIHNAALGTRALFNNTTGSYNTAYGFHAGPNTTDLTNSGAFGNEAATTASNQIRLGNSNVTQIGGQVGWSNFSDQRFKRQVQENVAGLDFILKLRPVTYHWDIDHLNRFIHGSAADTLFTDSIARSGIANQQRIAYSGFLAQEVEAAARSVGYDFSGVVAPANERTPYSLRYGEFVVPLVKAVQEQQRQLGQQSQVLAGLNARLERPVVRLTSADEWADRVFEPGYRLRPLAEVESYLREHRHLPGVPSAQVLAEQGVDVSGMLAKQMEKIEELTLYVVEADKKNEALQAENEFIKATTENALRLIEELQQEMKALRSEVSAQK